MQAVTARMVAPCPLSTRPVAAQAPGVITVSFRSLVSTCNLCRTQTTRIDEDLLNDLILARSSHQRSSRVADWQQGPVTWVRIALRLTLIEAYSVKRPNCRVESAFSGH